MKSNLDPEDDGTRFIIQSRSPWAAALLGPFDAWSDHSTKREDHQYLTLEGAQTALKQLKSHVFRRYFFAWRIVKLEVVG